MRLGTPAPGWGQETRAVREWMESGLYAVAAAQEPLAALLAVDEAREASLDERQTSLENLRRRADEARALAEQGNRRLDALREESEKLKALLGREEEFRQLARQADASGRALQQGKPAEDALLRERGPSRNWPGRLRRGDGSWPRESRSCPPLPRRSPPRRGTPRDAGSFPRGLHGSRGNFPAMSSSLWRLQHVRARRESWRNHKDARGKHMRRPSACAGSRHRLRLRPPGWRKRRLRRRNWRHSLRALESARNV